MQHMKSSAAQANRLPGERTAHRLSGGSRPLIPVILLVGLIGPLLLSTWYTVRLQQASLEAGFAYEFDRLADVLANGMSDPIWNLIPDSGAPLADSLMRDERVLSIEVISLAQGRFLLRSADERMGRARQQTLLTRDVMRDSIRIGTVAVLVDRSAMSAALAEQNRRIILAGAIGTAFSLAVVLFVFRFWKRLENERALREMNQKLQAEIAERSQAEAALRESEERIGGILHNSPSAIFLKDLEGRYRVVNPKFLEWFGFTESDVLGKTAQEIYPAERADTYSRIDEEVLAAGTSIEREFDNPFADGRAHTTIVTKFPVRDARGSVDGIGGLITDVTEFRQAEEQLHQNEKLQALGKLTGGVAHDFNNLLSVIVGNAEILEEDFGGRDGYDEKSVRAIKRAAMRGTELTQRLLAFSRRQPLLPQPVDMRDLLDDMTDLLRRTLGETIEVSMSAPLDIWAALVDAGQLENALLNLAINARDAMPGGGELTIDAANVTVADGRADSRPDPGDYVSIGMQDTGSGMAQEVRERAVEPFFTTKDVGDGSGLGLSMVYGFATQSGGTMTIASTQGEGTRVELLLPRADDRPLAETGDTAGASHHGAGETVLVIEDDVDVREMVEAELKSLGYRVLAAEDGRSGMEIIDSGAQIDLLLSDVVLPGGMSGPDLAQDVLARHPGLKLLFMSGYADSATRKTPLPDGAELLPKPFRKSDLAQRVHGLLNGG